MGASSPPSTPTQVRRPPPIYRYPQLPEIKFCYAVTIVTMCYAWYRVYQASVNYPWKIGDFGVFAKPPLIDSITGRRMKDQTNWEWTNWAPFTFKYIPVYLIHTVLFNLVSPILKEQIFMPIYILFSVAACCYYFTPFLVVVSIAQGTILFLVTHLAKKTIVVWLATLPLLYVVMHYSTWLSKNPFLIFTFVSYTLLSYVSYSIDTIRGCNRAEDVTLYQKFVRMLFYVFYQPYMVSLIVLYSDFEQQMKQRNNGQARRNWNEIISFTLRICLWWYLFELSNYYLYYEAILKNHKYLFSLPKDQFVALGMALGISFHVKYVVIFGFPSLFAKIDNLQPLLGPICLIRVTLYSKVWREFDRGLYKFFKSYIFVPICQPTFSLPRKIIGVLVSYGFVLMWHGFYHHNIVWILLNILALFIEMSSKVIYGLPKVDSFRKSFMSDVNFRRLLAVLHIIPFAIGLYSNFYFLGGSKVGQAFVQRFLIEETITLQWPFFLIITLGYFHSHTCIESDRLKALAQEKKDKEWEQNAHRKEE